MIQLHTFPPAFGVTTPSPFGLKVETYLRLAKLPYELVPTPDMRKAPKKKLPVLVDDGVTIADSAFILAHLVKKYGDRLDGALTDEQRGVGHAVCRMLEEGTYFTAVYGRWIEPDNWPVVRDNFFGKLPFPLRSLLPPMIQKKVRGALYAQGTGRHSREEIYALGNADLDAVSRVLGAKRYLLGDSPSSYDATVYGFVAQLLFVPFETPMKAHLKTKKNVVGYAERVRTEHFAGA